MKNILCAQKSILKFIKNKFAPPPKSLISCCEIQFGGRNQDFIAWILDPEGQIKDIELGNS